MHDPPAAGSAPVRICGIAGSLRERSYNRALLRTARDLMPDGAELLIFERLGDIPPYNADLEKSAATPEPVAALKSAIAESDGLLIATPEYNYGIPGVLKNAIDWASRPARQSVLAGKPAAILGASPGAMGTVRAQMQLRQVLLSTGTPVVPGPEVLVQRAAEKFDDELRLTDERTRELIAVLLRELADAAGAVRTAGSGATLRRR